MLICLVGRTVRCGRSEENVKRAVCSEKLAQLNNKLKDERLKNKQR